MVDNVGALWYFMPVPTLWDSEREGGETMGNMLRGQVLSRFSSISDFARAMNWDRKKASRIVNRVQKPTADDMEKMAELLNVNDPDDFIQIFLPSVSTMWEAK